MPTGLSRNALIETLNEFLEGERAGARTARAFAAESDDARLTSLMRRVAKDEAWCCAMLTKHIGRLGGEASRKTGTFFDKALRRQGERERLEYLNKGQTWVTARLNELLPEINDRLLHRDLIMMLRTHERNIKRCEGFNP
ncbi:MAG TPA: DUF6306 domain-containing protein [Gammaproteobacteria bacterium]|nr:DUF6306 domain-containing protein [Gammaproteobacteria bacterium]